MHSFTDNPAPKWNFEGKMHLRIAFGLLLILPVVLFIAGFVALTGFTGFIGTLAGIVTYFGFSIGLGYVARELFLDHLIAHLNWIIENIQKDAVTNYQRELDRQEQLNNQWLKEHAS
jgi:hypothetical protein